MRAGKSILVWAAALMMVANPASACRWRCRTYCGPVYCAPAYCAPRYCGPVYYEPTYCGSVPADCSAGGERTGGPVTTNRVPDHAPAESPTPQPTIEPTTPAAPTQPAPEPFEAPAFEPAPAPEKPMPAAPAEERLGLPTEPAPAEKAPAEAPAAKSEVEDLFSEPAAEPAMPAETKPEAPPSDVEDLFKDPAPAPPADKPKDEVDDLFKDLDDKNAASGEAHIPAPATPENKEIEDLFSDPQPESPMSAAVEPAPTPVKEAPTPVANVSEVKTELPRQDAATRLWTDNTGKYRVRGRLVVVGPTHVRILKENGKFTTVPYGRLSQADLAFVKRHANAAVVASF